mgnify:CR=1 FL=1
MLHTPEAVARELRQMKNPEIVPQQDRNLRGQDCHDHDNDEGDRHEPREQAHNDQHAANNLYHADERTHEIGIRKSLGARRRDILLQFLIESATVSTLGAALGVGVGAAITTIAAAVSPLPAHVVLWSVVVSVLLGTGIGIVAGVYPASRAARLDPIAALRAET